MDLRSKEPENRTPNTSVIRNVVLTLFVVVFFLSVIFIYYGMLYRETRDGIIKNGELNAVKAAKQIENYLEAGVSMVLLSGYTIDDMIQNGKSNEEIREYMKSENYAATNVVEEQVNGLYGYIRGQFLSGIGWIPYAGYDPLSRPWYKNAIDKTGKVAVANPYHDARTGAVMITLSKALNDAKSVIAIDMSIDGLQNITESLAEQGTTDMEIVLDSNYRVIAHSDKDEVGRYYSEKTGSFGNAIVSSMQNMPNGSNYFLMEFDGNRYIVYSMKIENDWTCLSVTDSTSAFEKLDMPLRATILVALIMIAMLIFVMVRSFRNDRLAAELKVRADEQAAIARVDQMTGLKNRRSYAEKLEELSRDVPSGCKVVVFDLNGLKEANDTYGHEAGDNLIIAAADCIRRAFDGVDDIYRIGGDEFCLITTMSDERVEKSLRDLAVICAGCKGKYINGVSISCGVGTDREHAHIESIVREADKNMYKQKQDYYSASDHDRRHIQR